MHNYSFEFKVVGEIADMLSLKHPERKLLVDVSSDVPGHEAGSIKKYPARTTITIRNELLIQKLLNELSIGDIVEASGTFTQTNYVPYRTTCIDTTFLAESFTVLEKQIKSKRRFVRPFQEVSGRSIH